MANSAHTTTLAHYQSQPGTVGRLRASRATITFGSDYAAATLPLITADELGLSEVVGVISEGQATDTGVTLSGNGVVVAVGTGGKNFTLALFNGDTAIGTVDCHTVSIPLLVLGH